MYGCGHFNVGYVTAMPPAPTNLKMLIAASGRSQGAIRTDLGVGHSAMSRMVQRKSDIPPRYIQPLAKLLNVDLETILQIATALPRGSRVKIRKHQQETL